MNRLNSALILAAAASFVAVPGSARSLPSLFQELHLAAPKLDVAVLQPALAAAQCAEESQAATKPHILAIIDYSRPSHLPRMWIFDLQRRQLLFEELVAHGKNSGADYTTAFSNAPGSLMSSMGVFVTGRTYQGSNGYSLKLHGLEAGLNHKSEERAVVIHGAGYVNKAFAQQHGRLGRSWGCPAVRKEIARSLIDTIKGGSVLFAYYPNQKWLRSSPALHCSQR